MARLAGVLLLSFTAGLPAFAGQSSASFQVSVRVPASATLSVVESAGGVEISAEDVARGYKQVAVRYRVTGTGRRGYLLQVAPRLGVVRRIEIGSSGTATATGDIPLEIHRPADGCLAAGCADEAALILRLVLDPDARPGSYPLPVRLAALPL